MRPHEWVVNRKRAEPVGASLALTSHSSRSQVLGLIDEPTSTARELVYAANVPMCGEL